MWYRSGTVAVTNGSANVVGTDTLWASQAKAGDIFIGPDSGLYEITGVTDDTHLAVKTLAGVAAYQGATLSAQGYAIIRNFTNTTNADLAAKLAALIASWQGREDEMIDWLAGTVGGGPNSNGTYPMTDALGNTSMVKCPAQMQADVDGPVASALVYKQEAQAARDQAVSIRETLPAIAINPTWPAPVACCVSANRFDTDGGNWKKRCSHTSWYNEARPAGVYLGLYANEAAARAAGGTTGDWYARSGSVAFYSLNAGSGETQIYRAGSAEFPAEVAVVAWASLVVLFDLSQPGAPMWMVFVRASGNSLAGAGISCVAARDATVIIGDSTYDLARVDFARDTCVRYGTVGITKRYVGGVSDRNAAKGFAGAVTSGSEIISRAINSCAIAVPDGYVVDQGTSLPIPIILVGTTGGWSQVNSDESVFSFSFQSLPSVNSIMYDESTGVVCWTGQSNLFSNNRGYFETPILTTSLLNTTVAGFGGVAYYYTSPNVPSFDYGTSESFTCVKNGSDLVIAHTNDPNAGIAIIRANKNSQSKGMVASITPNYNTGWMPGDIRGCFATKADGGSGSLTGKNILSEPFSTDAANSAAFVSAYPGWAYDGTCIASVASGVLTINRNGAATPTNVTYSLATTVGKKYTAFVHVVSATHGVQILLGGASLYYTSSPPLGLNVLEFTATATTTTLALGIAGSSSGSCVISAAVVAEGDSIPDYSRNGKSLPAITLGTGQLAKAPVATGAKLCALSGFSYTDASNYAYLEQPYNPDFDVNAGVNSLSGMAWVSVGASAGSQVIFERQEPARSNTAMLSLIINSSEQAAIYVGAVANSAISDVLPTDVWTHIAFTASAGVLRLYVNGRQVATGTAGNTTNASATFRAGLSAANTLPPVAGTKIAGIKICATNVSAEQIAHIYNTERPLFAANAVCTLPGSSNAVLSVARDKVTGLLHGHTSYGRFAFKDLLLVESEATAVGTPTCVAAADGMVVQGGSTAAKISVPSLSLRGRLERRNAPGDSSIVYKTFSGNGTTTAFALPAGYKATNGIAVGASAYHEGATKDWTQAYDGFLWTVTFAVAPASGTNNIKIPCKRWQQ